MKSSDNYFKATGDFSSYDQTIPKVITLMSFDMLKSIMRLTEYECQV
jgi:hypothetical protein